MQFQSLVAATLLGFAAAAPQLHNVDDLVRRQIPVKTCSHLTGGLHLIALGGANTDNPKDYGLLSTLAASVLAAIPGSTNVSLPYNKQFTTTTPPKLMPGAVAGGMTTLVQYINNYHHYCPNTKIAMIGYSSGGVIMMNDICAGGGANQIDQSLAGTTIIAQVTYGEETRVPGQTYDLGTCTTGSGTVPRANSALCYPFANNLQSYCDNMDPDCCSGTGSDTQVHFNYPTNYDAAATAFIKQKFQASM